MNEWQVRSRRRSVRRWFGVGVAVLAVLGGAWFWASGNPSAPSPSGGAVVDRVIDGDTVDVLLDGTLTRVRLLNIDTPETKKENTPIGCLGPEASEFLTSLLPIGSTIRLEYDVERADQYGRTLAAVFTADGRNASVELAARGLGRSVLFEPNDRYLADVEQAESDARAAGVGLFDPSIDCNAAG